MNIIEAVSIIEHSPSNIAKKIKSFILGFNGRRDVSFFDLFLFYPLYSYKPSYQYFNGLMKLDNKVNFFLYHTNNSPQIFVNVYKDYLSTILLVKEAILYGVNNNYFCIDEDYLVKLKRKTVNNECKVSKNIGKLLSCQSTAYLFKFFKVDINAI